MTEVWVSPLDEVGGFTDWVHFRLELVVLVTKVTFPIFVCGGRITLLGFT